MNISKFLLKENNNLDFIRIVCASMVIIGHSYVIYPSIGKVDVISRFTGFTYSGALAVKIFFCISGLLVTDSLLRSQSISKYLIHRTFRIMPGLIFLLIISTFIIGPLLSELPTTKYFTSPLTYNYFLYNLILETKYFLPGVFLRNFRSDVNSSLWSLRFEVRYYIVLVVIFAVARYIAGKKYIIPIYTFVVLFVFLDGIFKLHMLTTIKTDTEFSLVPMSFAFGCFLALYKQYLVINLKIVGIFVLLTMLLWHTPENEFFFTVTICLFALLLSANKYIKKIKIKYDISYGIYLWGFIVQQTIFHFGGNQNFYLFMGESLLLSYFMGLISYVAVEKRFMLYGKSFEKMVNKKLAN